MSRGWSFTFTLTDIKTSRKQNNPALELHSTVVSAFLPHVKLPKSCDL